MAAINITAMAQTSIYDFTVKTNKGADQSLSEYKGKVILVVNTATQCGFTPQYEDLDSLYDEFSGRGFTILDFPCNQFGGQAPESDEEIEQFCTLRFNTKFPRFKKIDVNGENEIPLYTWLKSQKGFAGFDAHPYKELLEKMFAQADPDWDDMFSKADPNYAEKPDIKWNFTKFLIDSEGNVVKRFEPTATKEVIAPEVEKLLK